MMQAHTAEWMAEFFDDVAALVPGGLRGPQGTLSPPLGALAAGMRTPSHLSPRPGDCGPASARMSPRTSLHNRDFGGAAGGGPSSPGPMRTNSLVRGSRSGAMAGLVTVTWAGA
jgi:hypothetical protein